MVQLLKEKTIMVTGGAGGIGRATCLILAAAGANIVVTDVTAEAGETVAEEIRKGGGQSTFVGADLQSEEDVRRLVETAVRTFGRLDGAFNNAGIENHRKAVADLPLSEWQQVLGVDLTGVFLCIKYQIPAMIASGGGSIVNTSSGTAQHAIPNTSEYITAKAGILGLTRAAAIDYSRQKIRVNAICPGLIQTPMSIRLEKDPAQAAQVAKVREAIPMGRLGEPDEVGETVKFLLSDHASYITGATINIDGGFSA